VRDSGRGKIVMKYKQFDDGKWVIDLKPVNGLKGVRNVRESGTTKQPLLKVVAPLSDMISAWVESGWE